MFRFAQHDNEYFLHALFFVIARRQPKQSTVFERPTRLLARNDTWNLVMLRRSETIPLDSYALRFFSRKRLQNDKTKAFSCHCEQSEAIKHP